MVLLNRTIGTFIADNWKLFVYGGAAGFLYWQVSAWAGEIIENRNEREEKILRLTQARDQALFQAVSAKTALEEVKRNEERLELLLADAVRKQDEIRAAAKAQKDAFRGHDLQKLSEAKPGLIEKLANKATQERMHAFEDAFNN